MRPWTTTRRSGRGLNTIASSIRLVEDATIESSTAKARSLSRSLPAAWNACLLSALAIGAGIVAALAPPLLVLALLAGLLLMIGATMAFRTGGYSRARQRTTTVGQTRFALVTIAILLVTFNAIRPVPGATASDLIFFVALLVIGMGFLDSGWRLGQIVPAWLLGAGVLLFSAALLTAIFPAQSSQAALLFPGGALSGDVVSPVPSPSNADVAIRLVGALVFLPAMIVVAANSTRRIQILADVWIAGAAVNGLVALLEYLGAVGIGASFSDVWIAGAAVNGLEALLEYLGEVGIGASLGDGRVMGLTNHVNALGLVSAMALPVAASRLGRASGRARFYYSAAVASVVVGIAVSGSRAAVLGGILGLVFVGALYKEDRRGFVRTAGLAAVLVVLVAVLFSPFPAVERLFGGSDPYGHVAASNQAREAIYPAVWDEVLHRPLVGHGFQYVRGAHNIYLQLLHAGGVIALTGFLIFALGSTATGFRLGRSKVVPDPLRSLAIACVASLVVWFAAGGLVGTAIFDRFLFIPVGLIAAIWALSRRPSSGAPPRMPGSL